MMTKIIAAIVCFVAVCNSFPIWPGFPHGSYYGGAPYYHGGYPYGGPYPYGSVPHARLVYYGQFKGSCDGAPDGLYFVDEYSFAYCSNGQKTIQPCAEGSANPPLDYFKSGGYYGFYDFCAVNLLAKGYNGHQVVDTKDNSYPHPVGYDVEKSKGYEPPMKVGDYKETYHREPVYIEPKKAMY